jgi:hypothetical protein
VDVERSDHVFWSAVAVPLFAMALLVCEYRFGWRDAGVVMRINDALMRENAELESG